MNTLEPFFDWLVAASVRASIIAVCVLGLQLALQRRLPARWRYALWLPMILVLLLPLLPTRPWSFGFTAEPAMVEATALTPTVAGPGFAETFGGNVTAVASSTPIPWKDIGLWTWLLGACSGLALTVGSYLRALNKHSVRPSRLNSDVVAMIKREADALGLRLMPEVRLVPSSHSPAVAGLLRPLLLLPANFPEGFTQSEARLIIRHELMHVRRLDLPVNWLMCGLQCLHWFNPVLWLAFSRMRADRELACDAAVLAVGSADQRADYGHALLKLQHVGPLPASSLALMGIFGRRSAMRGRITRIADFTPASRVWNIFAGALLAAVTFLGVTRAQSPEPAAGKSDAGLVNGAAKKKNVNASRLGAPKVPASDALKAANDRNEKKLDQIIFPSVSFKGASLREAVDFLRIKSRTLDTTESDPKRKGVAILIKPNSTGKPSTAQISLDLTHVPLRVALNFVAELADYKVTVRPAWVELASNSAAQGAQRRPLPELKPVPEEGREVEKKMTSLILPRVAFSEASIEEAVSFLRVKSRELDTAESEPARKGVNIVMDVTKVDPATKITLDLIDVPLREALLYTAELANLQMTIGPAGVLLASQASSLSPARASGKAPSGRAVEIAQKLVLKQVEFSNATLDEGLEFIRVKARAIDPEKRGVNIVVRPGANTQARLTLSLKEAPVWEALRYVAELADLQIEATDDSIVLAPKTK